MHGSLTCLNLHFSMHDLQVLTINNSDPTQYHRYHLAWHSRFIAECNISSLEDWSTSVTKINLNKNLCKLESVQAVLPVTTIALTGRQSRESRFGLTCASSILQRVGTINRKRGCLTGPARAMERCRSVDQVATPAMSHSHSGTRAECGRRRPAQ
jgi:hypothetical protein